MSQATLYEINRKAIKALSEKLDPIDFTRFFQQYEKGYGDYTKERHKILKNISLDNIEKGIEELRKNQA